MKELEKVKESLDNALDYLKLVDKGTYGNLTMSELVESRKIVEKLILCGVVKSFYCECDAPLIRTNGTGGEYCANCNLDLEQ